MEYVALAWVLRKRWRAKVEPRRGGTTGPNGDAVLGGARRPSAGYDAQHHAGEDTVADEPSFVDVIRTYCAGLGRHAHTRRQRWVRELPADGETRPEHWPDTASWERHAPRWRRVLQLVDEWAAGEHPDPCPRARHFGGPMDEPRGRMRAVCARLPVNNRFFEVMR